VRRHEAEREANTKRALELLAMTRAYSSGSGEVVVQGRWSGFRRGRVLVRRVRW
jgi:hypothetical protein